MTMWNEWGATDKAGSAASSVRNIFGCSALTSSADSACQWHPVLLLLLVALAVAAPAAAQTAPAPEPLRKVAFDQKLGAQLDLGLRFTDSTGKPVRIGDYFDDRPVILVMAYYECPMLCDMVLNGIVRTLQELPFDAGDQYEWVVVGIDPEETPAQARKKKNTYAARYAHGGAERGWHFLLGDERAIKRVAGTIGFRYAHDPESGEYAHPAGAVVLTPGGKVSHYFFGTDFDPADLRLGLVEASGSKIGSPVDQILLRCYHYDPETGQYTFAVMSAVRAGGVLMMLSLGGLVGGLLYYERRKKRGGAPG